MNRMITKLTKNQKLKRQMNQFVNLRDFTKHLFMIYSNHLKLY